MVFALIIEIRMFVRVFFFFFNFIIVAVDKVEFVNLDVKYDSYMTCFLRCELLL
jgi:hypothetical protein